MKDLEKRFNNVCKAVGDVTVVDISYSLGDFENWAKHSLEFWYEIEKTAKLIDNIKFIENELESLEQLVKEKESNEVFYL